MKEISGSLTVKSTPTTADPTAKELGAITMRFDKTFEGPLSATSVVSMQGFMDMTTQSGAYVALEKVTGSLEGRSGEFSLAHCSLMDMGVGKQSIQVVPGSGSGELRGLAGSMEIDISEGKHSYRFLYQIDA